LLGIEFTGKAGDTFNRLLAAGIITGTSSDPHVLRLLPPLNTSLNDIDVLIKELS